MAGPTITLSMLGGTYAFKSLNPNDSVLYQGTIVDIFTYSKATQYRDVLAYNQSCRQVDPSIPVDPSAINPYFLIELNNTSGTQSSYSFCSQWIMPGSWQSLNTVSVVMVKVLNPNPTTQGILEALASQGYPDATIQSTTLVPPSGSTPSSTSMTNSAT